MRIGPSKRGCLHGSILEVVGAEKVCRRADPGQGVMG